MGVQRHGGTVTNWGAASTAASTASTFLSLPATGAGTWDQIDSHVCTRQGATAFPTGTDIFHNFTVFAKVTGALGTDLIGFRLYDTAGSLVVATIGYSLFTGYTAYQLQQGVAVTTATFTNLPASSKRVEMQYTCVAPITLTFYVGAWSWSRYF